jgi:hypothetical protein
LRRPKANPGPPKKFGSGSKAGFAGENWDVQLVSFSWPGKHNQVWSVFGIAISFAALFFIMGFIGRALAGALVLVLTVVGNAAPVIFNPLYADGPGEGFNDPSLGAARQTAFQYALGVMGSFLQASYAGETVTVRAKFDPLGGTATSAVLAGAGATNFYTGLSTPVPGVFYPYALTNHLIGFDIDGSPEIDVTFNSDVDNATVLGATNWYYGVDGLAAANVDLVSVTLHELGHGLGFTGFLNQTGSYFSNVNFPNGLASIFDYFINTSSTGGTKLVNMAPLTTADPARAAEIIGNDLWWDGAQGTAGGGGVRPKLHAPSTYAAGSSVYHLDEATLGGELLSPFYSGVDQALSPREIGMLRDIGWAAIPEPEAWLFGMVSAFGVSAVLVFRR